MIESNFRGLEALGVNKDIISENRCAHYTEHKLPEVVRLNDNAVEERTVGTSEISCGIA